MYYGNNVVDKFNRSLRKYYSADGSIEIKYTKATTTLPEKVEFFTYIGGDAYSAPLVVRKIDNDIYENFYLHRDHLGSILAITNSTGSIIEKRLFDAWGKILKIQNGSGVTLTRFAFFDRGYTGHEHLQGVALINMNGRVYDPQLHRFLQPDNNIQDPFNTQNFNRYGYVLNNPLKYTDESGEFWGTLFSFLGQALISSYVHTAQATGEGNVFKWDAQTWQSFGMNTASAGATYGATNYANSYIDHYNDKPELGVAAGPVDNFSSGNQESINFFDNTPDQVKFNDVYKYNSKYKLNGDIGFNFGVYGHGANFHEMGFIRDNKRRSDGKDIFVEDFENIMSSMSLTYKGLMDRGIDPDYMCFNVCSSASGKNSLAQQYSNNHPFTRVVGFDGYAMYGKVNGVPMISAISTNLLTPNNLGYIVVFKGGVIVDRMLYSDYLKKYKK